MPANPHTCYAVSCMRSPPGAPPACSRAPAPPIPTAPDRPETSADTLLKVGSKIGSNFGSKFGSKFWRKFALTFAPAPIPAPPQPCLPPESLHNTAVSALGSPQSPPLMPDLGVTPVICRDHQSFQFFTASGKLGQDAILTGKP